MLLSVVLVLNRVVKRLRRFVSFHGTTVGYRTMIRTKSHLQVALLQESLLTTF